MISKNDNIKNSIKATVERHSSMDCRVFEVKVLGRKLNIKQKRHLQRLFLEGKWLYNTSLANRDGVRSPKSVCIKVGDAFEIRELTVLGSQMKQDIVDSIKHSIKGLHTKKTHGEKVEHLKFKSFCNMIPLRQYGTTYRIDFDKNTISIQNFKKPLKVRGLSQIPEGDIANARLVRKPSGIYFHITVFTDKEERPATHKKVGIDFGIKDTLVMSDGSVVDIKVPETKNVKLASRRFSRSFVKNGRKRSNNHYKRKHKLQKAYEKQNNIKKDIVNKTVHNILENDFIAIQDEMIHNWHKGLFGKQVQHSAMGSIK